VLVDPIDGSRNAVHGIPFYGTSLAIVAVASVRDLYLASIINLVNSDAVWSEKGNYAFCRGNSMRGHTGEEFSFVAFEASTPSRDSSPIMPLLSAANKVRSMGATARDLAYVACGAVSVFAAASASRSFDFAGGYLLIKESGSTITDLQGNQLVTLDLKLKGTMSLLAAGNIGLHKKALALLHR